jgi:flagellar biosynthesis/type III secretory pathway ATPase
MARSSASRVAHRITEGKHLPSATTIRSSPDYGQASHPAISIGKDRRKADAVLAPD